MRPQGPVRLLTVVGVALVVGSGCQGMAARRKVVVKEPALASPDGVGSTVIEEDPADQLAVAPPMTDSIVENHPLLSRPRDYYESSGNNKIVKTAAAVVVGVPAGIVGELRQIVRGRPVAAPVVPASSRY